MAPVRLSDILSLPREERIRLVEEIWDSIARESEALPLTAEQAAELDRRIAEYEANPEEGEPWEVVRERIRNSRCRTD
jgi:putative addiction module component (TIGR02574 family)